MILGHPDASWATGLPERLVARGYRIIADSGSTEQLLTDAVESQPAVLVLDGRLPGPDLRAVARRVEREPGLIVLLVGPLLPHIEVLLALASGVSGYLSPESEPELIADAVSALCAGEVVLPRAMLQLVKDLHLAGRGITVHRVDGQLVELTHREWEVLVLVRQAYSTAEIAKRLVIARVTVRTHIGALIHKLGVRDRTVLMGPFTA